MINTSGPGHAKAHRRHRHDRIGQDDPSRNAVASTISRAAHRARRGSSIEPGWVPATSPTMFRARASAAIATPAWVTDGNYSGFLRDIVWPAAGHARLARLPVPRRPVAAVPADDVARPAADRALERQPGVPADALLDARLALPVGEEHALEAPAGSGRPCSGNRRWRTCASCACGARARPRPGSEGWARAGPKPQNSRSRAAEPLEAGVSSTDDRRPTTDDRRPTTFVHANPCTRPRRGPYCTGARGAVGDRS